MNQHPIQWLVPVVLMFAGLTFGLANYPLLDPDEGRNAEVAREMAATNDYVLPRLNGLPYLDKPVVFFAVTAASMEILGPSVLAARLAPLLFTLLTLTLVWWFGRKIYGPAGGWLAAIATGTMPLTIGFARTVIFDSALTFFVTASFVSFYYGLNAEESADGQSSASTWIPAAFGCVALGVLTKGPIAFVIPFLAVIPFSIWRKRWRRLFDPIGWLLLIAIILPWVAAVSREVPDFVRYVVYTESLGRLFTDQLNRTGPIWYFLPIVFCGALPWSLVVLAGWRRNDRSWKTVYLLLWITVPLVFFSLSQSKRPQYVVPLMPAVGLLVAHLWSSAKGALPGARATAVALLPIAAVLAPAPFVVNRLLDVTPAIASTLPRTSLILSAATFFTAVGLWIWHDRPVFALSVLCLPAAAIALGSTALMKAIGEDRSAYAAAQAMLPKMDQTTEIVAIDVYPLSLPFYLQRTFTLSTTNGSELTSNYLARSLERFRENLDTPVRPPDWWFDALVDCTRPRIFLVAPNNLRVRETLETRLPLIVSTPKMSAFGPCRSEVLALGPAANPFVADRE